MWTSRTEALLGKEAVEKLAASQVIIFGLGGVGSWAAEALVRSGIGEITLVDADAVELSNLNRQLPALRSTLGQAKAKVLAERFQDINPQLKTHVFQRLYEPGDGSFFLDGSNIPQPHLVLDCIDDLKAKTDLIDYCAKNIVPVLTAGGCARRLDPSRLKLQDIQETSHDPMLKRLRKRLREIGLANLPVIASDEPFPQAANSDFIASAVFVPASCGLAMAYHAVNHLIGTQKLPQVFAEA